MAQTSQDGKLVQMVKMLLFYRKSRSPDVNFAQAVSQIMALALQDGCSNFGRFVEKTIKTNQRVANFKLPIFYNQIKGENRFSAQNLAKAYMLNFSFSQFGRDLFSKALADFYSPDAFCLNYFALIRELTQLCAEDDFSAVTYDQEAINLREMRESLKEADPAFKEYLELQASIAETSRTRDPGTEQGANEGRGTASAEQEQQSESKTGLSDILGAASVFKSIGKLFAGAAVEQHEEGKQNTQEARVQPENLLELEAATKLQSLSDQKKQEADQMLGDAFVQNQEIPAQPSSAAADEPQVQQHNLSDQQQILTISEPQQQLEGDLAGLAGENGFKQQCEAEIAEDRGDSTAQVDKEPEDTSLENDQPAIVAADVAIKLVQADLSDQYPKGDQTEPIKSLESRASNSENATTHQEKVTTDVDQEVQSVDLESKNQEGSQENQRVTQRAQQENSHNIDHRELQSSDYAESSFSSHEQEKTLHSDDDAKRSTQNVEERNPLQPQLFGKQGSEPDQHEQQDLPTEENASTDLLLSSQNENEPDSSSKQGPDWLSAQKSKLADIFDTVFQHISSKEGQTAQEQQQPRSGMSVKDVIDVYYAYKERFGFTQTTATMAFTILVRILAASDSLRQFIDETCRFQNDNKNFKLKLFCGKEYQQLQGSLAIAQHIVRGYMANYMIQLLFADIYSKAVEIFYPAESLLVKEPLVMQQFCADLVSIDFNQFEFSYEKTIVKQVQAELQQGEAEKLTIQRLDVESGNVAQNQPQLELQLDENDFLSHIQLLDQTEVQEDRNQPQYHSQGVEEQDLQSTEPNLDQSSSDASAHDQGKLASQFEFKVHGALDNGAAVQKPSEVNLQSSSEQSSSELTLTEQCVESQPFEPAARSLEEERHPVSYESYQKFNNTELFVREIDYRANYFTTAQSGHIVQAEKAASGRKMRVQAVKPKPLQSFTLLTQGPLQFQRHCAIRPTNVLFDYPQLEGRPCSECACALDQDGFFCFNCGLFFCAKHECLRTVLPQYCILGSFTLKTVCLNCYSAVQHQLLGILVPEEELVVQVRHSVQYGECRRLRTTLLALECLRWRDQQRPTGSAYGSDLDYYREASLEVSSFPDEEHFCISLEVRSMRWTFSDVAGFFDGAVKDRLAIEIQKAMQHLAGKRCACGAEIQRSSVAVCPSCLTLRCQACLLDCCAQKQ